VIVFVAGNASVTGQRNSRIHLRSFVIRPAATRGVVDAAGLRPTISPGSWGTIFGDGLAQTTRSWRPEEILSGELPAMLDGVRVRVNGRAAAIHYISPEQINFQAPDDVIDAPRDVPVEVWHEERLAGTWRVTQAARAPGLFVVPENGRDYAAATHTDGCLVGRPRMDGNACSRPAMPGESIALYGTGFGLTEPRVPAGQVPQTIAPTLVSAVARIGGQTAPVSFSGLVSAGRYRINLTVPDLPPGDHPVEVAIDGQSTQPHVYIHTGSGNP